MPLTKHFDAFTIVAPGLIRRADQTPAASFVASRYSPSLPSTGVPLGGEWRVSG